MKHVPHSIGREHPAGRPANHDTAILVERVILLSAVLGSIAAIVVGAYLAHHLHDAHWMNRAGAAIVILQVACAFAEFARRRRLEALRHALLEEPPIGPHHHRAPASSAEQKNRIVESEIGRSEMQAITFVLGLAAIGEFFHGFGDLVIEMMWH